MAVQASKSQSELSAGMVQLLTPVVEQCDMRLSAVLEAQKALAKQIHLLSAELLNSECEKEGDQQPDAVLGSYAAKLAASRKKLKKVEMLAMQTRNRVENIERMHDQLLVSEKAFKDRVEGKVDENPAEGAGSGAALSENAETVKVEATSGGAEDIKEEKAQDQAAERLAGAAASVAAETSAEAAGPQAEGDGGQEEPAQEAAKAAGVSTKKKKK